MLAAGCGGFFHHRQMESLDCQLTAYQKTSKK
jgi:hypothetical protein